MPEIPVQVGTVVPGIRSPGSPTGRGGWSESGGYLRLAGGSQPRCQAGWGSLVPSLLRGGTHSALAPAGLAQQDAGASRPAAATGERRAGSPADPRARARSGLSGATEGMPALHQLLGLAEHLVPVLQLLAPGIHVGAHHHPAQHMALCGGGKTSSLSGPQKPHHFSNIPRAFSLSLSHLLLLWKGGASPLPL